MGGYIGSKAVVTQVDGYNRTEADAEFVNDPNDVITVSGSNVGISVSSPDSTPSTKLHIREDDGTDYRARAVVQASDQRLVLGSHWQAGVAQYSYVQATNDAETGAQNLLLNPDGGHLLAGTADVAQYNKTSGSGISLLNGGEIQAASSNNCFAANRTNAVDGDVLKFFKQGVVVGSISVTGASTAYNTSSDYRLKTDAQPMTGASARVQALNPVNFEWIADGTRVDGFLAHEAQEVVPEAVHGTKDAMRDEEYEVTPAILDHDGNVFTEAVMGTRSVPDYQGIDQSKLVPLLTAALQEALTKIDDMETRLAALEGN
jgi:hypothetical protein